MAVEGVMIAATCCGSVEVLNVMVFVDRLTPFTGHAMFTVIVADAVFPVVSKLLANSVVVPLFNGITVTVFPK